MRGVSNFWQQGSKASHRATDSTYTTIILLYCCRCHEQPYQAHTAAATTPPNTRIKNKTHRALHAMDNSVLLYRKREVALQQRASWDLLKDEKLSGDKKWWEPSQTQHKQRAGGTGDRSRAVQAKQKTTKQTLSSGSMIVHLNREEEATQYYHRVSTVGCQVPLTFWFPNIM